MHKDNNLKSRILFDENKYNSRIARDHDMRIGMIGGALLGVGAGSALAGAYETDKTPLSKVLARRILFGGIGASAGAFGGKKLAAYLYDEGTTDKVIDKVLRKLAIRRIASFCDPELHR